jgi:hypothetical protein
MLRIMGGACYQTTAHGQLQTEVPGYVPVCYLGHCTRAAHAGARRLLLCYLGLLLDDSHSIRFVPARLYRNCTRAAHAQRAMALLHTDSLTPATGCVTNTFCELRRWRAECWATASGSWSSARTRAQHRAMPQRAGPARASCWSAGLQCRAAAGPAADVAWVLGYVVCYLRRLHAGSSR